MKVAISICSDNACALNNGEYCLRLISGMELGDLDTCICLKYNMRYIVLFCHGVLNGTYRYTDDTVFFLVYGNMLLDCCICRRRDKLLHLLTATYYGNIGVHDLDDDITAMIATIKCNCHNDILLDMH